MSDETQQARKRVESPPSFFPAAEAPSFCSRPTPVVPANDDLRSFGSLDAEGSGPRAIATPSSRPTVGPGELEPVRVIASDRPTVAPDEVLAQIFERATIGTPVPAPAVSPPDVTVAPTATPRRSRGRALAARALFTVLFGGVLGLLGYAVRPQLMHAVDVVRARVTVQSAPGR